MVKIRSAGKVVVLPDELVGIEPPNAYIAALFRHTAKMNEQREEIKNLKAGETLGASKDMIHHIKMLSLFPNIYMRPRK